MRQGAASTAVGPEPCLPLGAFRAQGGQEGTGPSRPGFAPSEPSTTSPLPVPGTHVRATGWAIPLHKDQAKRSSVSGSLALTCGANRRPPRRQVSARKRYLWAGARRGRRRAGPPAVRVSIIFANHVRLLMPKFRITHPMLSPEQEYEEDHDGHGQDCQAHHGIHVDHLTSSLCGEIHATRRTRARS